MVLCLSVSSASKCSTSILDFFVSSVYLPYARLRKRSWYVDERIAHKYISPTFGGRSLTNIQRHEVEGWLNNLLSSGLAPSTCNRILAVFKTIYSFAVKYGNLPVWQSPCAGVLPFRIHTRRERCLSLADAQRLMRELKKMHCQEATALILLLSTGARKSEILHARWEDVNLDVKMLKVPLSKSGKPRYISLSDEAIAILRNMPKHPNSPWLFPSRTPKKPLRDIYRFWNKLRRRIGLYDVRIHDLRHTFASLLVNAGHSLYEVQKLLGHSDPRITMRYAHLNRASLAAAVNTVSALLAKSSSKPRKKRKHKKDAPIRHTACALCRAIIALLPHIVGEMKWIP